MKILVLNCGSSSLKYQLINMETNDVLASGKYERIGEEEAFITHKVNGQKIEIKHPALNHEEAIDFTLKQLINPDYKVVDSLDEISAIGHRVVHGGEYFSSPVIITDEVIKKVDECAELAPLHNKAAVLGMKACQSVMPGKPMVVVFDTAFHQTIPKERYIYPIPYEYYKKYGIRKYGFHGTSHQFVSNRAAEIIGKDIKDLKIVSCHLGQGGSVCAIKDGKSVETSMGLTPLGGVPMGTRSGDLDPSVVTYIMKKENLSPDEMSYILNKQSGAYGISGVSVDFRDIEADAAAGGHHAQLALDNYHYLIACYIARCVVAMNGIDVLTFTAGVGEKGQDSRKAICDHLGFFGVELDEGLNQKIKGEEAEISSPNSKVKVFVIPTNEELMIARETKKVIEK